MFLSFVKVNEESVGFRLLVGPKMQLWVLQVVMSFFLFVCFLDFIDTGDSL